MAYLMLSGKWIPGLTVFILAGLTDIVDGYIARKFQVISNFGKLADPLADKLLHLTALQILSHRGRLPVYFFWILCIKELAMIIGSLFFLKKKGCCLFQLGWKGGGCHPFYRNYTVVSQQTGCDICALGGRCSIIFSRSKLSCKIS